MMWCNWLCFEVVVIAADVIASSSSRFCQVTDNVKGNDKAEVKLLTLTVSWMLWLQQLYIYSIAQAAGGGVYSNTVSTYCTCYAGS